MQSDSQFIEFELRASLGDRFEHCPTVNGFPASMIEVDDPDAANIIKVLEFYARFNLAHQELSLNQTETRRALLIDVLREKKDLDVQLSVQGIVAEGQAEGGLVFNVLYTTPRKNWNPTIRHLHTVVLSLSEGGS